MKRIPTTDLKPGMFTARPVRTAAGQIILDEGCLLSAQTILHIRDYSIPEVWIRDSSDSSGGLHDYLQKQYAPVRSRSERIRQSEEYKIFSQKFISQLKVNIEDKFPPESNLRGVLQAGGDRAWQQSGITTRCSE